MAVAHGQTVRTLLPAHCVLLNVHLHANDNNICLKSSIRSGVVGHYNELCKITVIFATGHLFECSKFSVIQDVLSLVNALYFTSDENKHVHTLSIATFRYQFWAVKARTTKVAAIAAANAKAPMTHPSAKEVKAVRAKGEAWGFTLEQTPGGYAIATIKIGSPLYVGTASHSL